MGSEYDKVNAMRRAVDSGPLSDVLGDLGFAQTAPRERESLLTYRRGDLVLDVMWTLGSDMYTVYLEGNVTSPEFSFKPEGFALGEVMKVHGFRMHEYNRLGRGQFRGNSREEIEASLVRLAQRIPEMGEALTEAGFPGAEAFYEYQQAHRRRWTIDVEIQDAHEDLERAWKAQAWGSVISAFDRLPEAERKRSEVLKRNAALKRL